MKFFCRVFLKIKKNDQWDQSQTFTKYAVGTDPKYEIDLSGDCLYERFCREVPMVKKNKLWD